MDREVRLGAVCFARLHHLAQEVGRVLRTAGGVCR